MSGHVVPLDVSKLSQPAYDVHLHVGSESWGHHTMVRELSVHMQGQVTVSVHD